MLDTSVWMCETKTVNLRLILRLLHDNDDNDNDSGDVL